MRWLAVVLISSSCSKPNTPPPVVEPQCTLATPLVPGIPGSAGHLVASERNPNGASALATLMRQFVADWASTRQSLERGPVVASAKWPSHRLMRCVWPTDVADRNETFDALAVGYLDAVKAFDARPARETYSGVIDACAACHEVTCGGPLEVIDGLRLRR